MGGWIERERREGGYALTVEFFDSGRGGGGDKTVGGRGVTGVTDR